jgi:tetratricopeptide (TPR) repeat protein
MHYLIGIALIASMSLLALPQTAFAQGAEAAEVARRVEQLSGEGAQRYRAGDFKGAIDLFTQAYALKPVPNLLYNIARCHEQLQNWKEAIAFYERFIVAPDVESEARQHAMQQVQSIREIAGLQRERDQREPTPVAPAPQPEPVAKPNRTAAYVTLGAGVGLLATGGVFGLMASGTETAFHDAPKAEDRKSLRQTGQTQALIADVCFVSGAAAAVVGTYLFVRAKPDERPASTVSLHPWFAPTGAGLGLKLGF